MSDTKLPVREPEARHLRAASTLLKALSDELPKAMASNRLDSWREAGHAIINLVSSH